MKLDHVTVICNDIDASVEFYRKLPGFTVYQPSHNGYSEAKNDGVTLGLFSRELWLERVGAELPQATGNALIQFSVTDVAATFQAAVAAGGRPVKEPQQLPWGSLSAFVADPDGHVLEFYRWG
jgi:lactoylglutathione lyase